MLQNQSKNKTKQKKKYKQTNLDYFPNATYLYADLFVILV